MISNSPFSRRSPSRRAYLIAHFLIAIALTGAHLEANPTADPDAQFDLKNAKGMEVRLAGYLDQSSRSPWRFCGCRPGL